MNQVEKPKRAKLWKGSSKKKTDKASDDQKPNTKVKHDTEPPKNKKKVHFASKPQTAKESPKKSLKRKSNFDESSPNKKAKPNNISNQDWKLLNKGNRKKPLNSSDKPKTPTEPLTHKQARLQKKERKKLKMVQKGKAENYDITNQLKSLWETLRRDDCQAEEKTKLLKKICDLLKGRVKEFTFAHDTVRVLECVLSEGSLVERSFLFEELKDDILRLTKCKYSKFLVIKMLKYGSKEQKTHILNVFHSKVIELIRHTEAAAVIECAFNECANATQRNGFVQEFYGPSFKYFKDADCHSLSKLLEKEPEKKTTILENMKTELMKVLEKNVVKHSLVHHILWQFMQNCDLSSKAEIIESLRDAVPEILHTKEGSRVAMQCVWFGSAKDRKVIVKSMKTFVCKIAMEEFGHFVLLTLFDCCDDTQLLSKHIIKELCENALAVSQTVHGKKVFTYLLSARDSHYIHPDVMSILEKGDANRFSKKDPEIRQSELRAATSQHLLDLVKNNIENLYKDNAFCHFTSFVLQHAEGKKEDAYKSVCNLVVEPYTSENKNVHAIEYKGSSFLFKQLIVADKDKTDEDCTFSKALVTEVPALVFKSWIECNRGAFLLLSLMETKIPCVVKRITEDLKGCNKYLAKKTYKGAELLLNILKS